MRRSHRVLVAAMLATTAAACGGSSNGTSPRAGATSTPPSAAAKVTVTSSIPEGAVLTKALTWQATPNAGSDPVTKVEFSIDGKVRWTEMEEPYVFDEDG